LGKVAKKDDQTKTELNLNTKFGLLVEFNDA